MITFLYWIHLPEYTDPKTQGYIGVTNNCKRRWNTHKRCAKDGTSKTPHLANAINYYSNLQYTVLFQGPAEGCYQLEEYFRPTPDIGWNVKQGGIYATMSESCKTKMSKLAKQRFEQGKNTNLRKGIPENCTHPMTGKSHSFSTKAKMRASKLGKSLTATHIVNMTKAHERAVVCVETGTIFDSAKKAALAVGLKSPGNITLVCKGKQKTAATFTWRYA